MRPSGRRSCQRLFTEHRLGAQRPTPGIFLHKALTSALQTLLRVCLSVKETDPERRNELLFFLPCP